MRQKESIQYDQIAQAIGYIRSRFREQPSLEEMALHVHMSPFHFQRVFTEWAGVSPKKFVQYLSVEYAKMILKNSKSTLFDVAYETGLSGTGRLHDLFVNIEGMTPGEYKNGGANLRINYGFVQSPFGKILVASTDKGICHMTFADDEDAELNLLKSNFPSAEFHNLHDTHQRNARQIFNQDWQQLQAIRLHLKATPFQLKVWDALLKIPAGALATYGQIAANIQQPTASRAVGTAIGLNPVAFLIPCHRVIRAEGILGGYHWGLDRKAAILGWEFARIDGQ
ncbi:MAG: methylated-DNA--[protein]-cysteine S-methyltransferase [Saprospiraceae bacterium]|nr:methylated-DNA--[protein]-cysteine S-methyltransferase [Saprospiraceae bacterium]HMW38596.1 methylated-DNA--[protein]-cysteine S-methyltransferase [Saprospiraceae bacterium]HMX88494.1 methylated-DNA--[protein]-cysteine S-methyltransferase [Saprospiraceae bacterium]HMZ40512.1 methylated-DNA--[protein]-cysteine S-methyltransferase [Saprospiraceae bacterium]HNA64565.1 methylated-DNA--[protein]-cysteine S-methyltransferase [Saprospiraceae bacterium]